VPLKGKAYSCSFDTMKKLQSRGWLTFLTNKYAISGLLFAIWMLFFDANSWLLQRELNQEIDALEESINYYTTELKHDRKELHELNSNPQAFEKYAREQFWMHREGEEIYLFDIADDGF
jgi:cell division protein DivIC